MLEFSIAGRITPHAEGAVSLNLAEGEYSKKVLLVHGSECPLPTKQGPNVNHASVPRHNVLLLSTGVFGNLVESIDIRIGQHAIMAKLYNRQVDKLQEREACEDDDDTKEAGGVRGEIRGLLDEAVEALDDFHDEVTKLNPFNIQSTEIPRR